MPDFRMTDQAKADLQQAALTVGTKSLRAAQSLIANFLRKSRRFARFPYLGIPRDDLAANLRCFVVSSYVVFYRPVPDTIEVLRILHGSRDIDSILKNPDNN